MSTDTAEQIQTLEVTKDEEIAAPIDIVFETILEQMGPYCETPEGAPLPLKLEAWPGGRWYRDLGNNSGHLWGHVQSIKAPTLLEVYGPLFMSYPAMSNVQYRLSEEGGVTRVMFSHRAIGLISPEHRAGGRLSEGWINLLKRVRIAVERKRGGARGSKQ
jgi:hypothetical protein